MMPLNEWGPTKVIIPCVNHFATSSDASEAVGSHSMDVNIEISVNQVSSASYLRELQAVFPNWGSISSATIITTMQNSAIDLVGIGTQLETEKDMLLEKFVSVARLICDQIISAGFSADYIDPCSGLPGICLDGNIVFNEVQSAQILLGYKMMNVGCCKVILHPEWGSAVYPASIVALAPTDVVITIIEGLSKK